MIFSRTSSKADLKELELENILLEYLQMPKTVENYSNALYKFWDYSVLFSVVNHYDLYNSRILNITLNEEDTTLSIISNYRGILINTVTYSNFSRMKIRTNRYDLICCFGLLEYVKNHYQLLEKAAKHVEIGGILLITTDDSNKKKKRIITSTDFINMSLMLESYGYELCSTEFDMLSYNDSSNLHSLVIQRTGN